MPTGSIIDLASTPGLKMVLVPISGETADKIMQENPGVFHKSVFPKGVYPGLESDVETIAITAVLTAMDTFPEDRLAEILDALFTYKADLAAVAKAVADLTPESAISRVSPDSLHYLHAVAAKFFRDKGFLK